MLHKTRGIIIKLTDYSETSVVVQIFTEKFGLQSYLINGVKKQKAKIKANMLQPLHLVDLVAYHKPNGNIQRISELRNSPVLLTIPYEIAKSSIVLFLNEVVYKCIKHHDDDIQLFEFLHHSIELLDRTEQNCANFHLYFLLQLTRYLGFYPDRGQEAGASYFDLHDGNYLKELPSHAQVIGGADLTCFIALLKSTFENFHQIKMPSVVRKQLLEKILLYYQVHIEGFGNVKSASVLEEVLGS